MTRSKRIFAGLLSGYGAIGINVLYTLASVPLALHYLAKDEFGLWLVIGQITGYLALLEFGLSISVARLLADHKDDKTNGLYGNIVKTGNWIFILQGGAIGIAGFCLAPLLAKSLSIPTTLQNPFIFLFSLQTAVTGLHISTRTLGAILWCHQRHDLINLLASASIAASFAAQWIGFHFGFNLYSMVFGTLASFIVSNGLAVIANRRCGYTPPSALRSRFDSTIFRDLIHFGSGMFLINVGNQLASASQLVLVSKTMGLEAASIWSIATKLGTLSQNFAARIFDTSSPALSEMFARGEHDRLKSRFIDVFIATAAIALTAAGGIAMFNAVFLEIWTSSKISWNPINDLLLALFVFLWSTTRCFTGIATVTKDLKQIKYACLLEGVFFIIFAYVLGQFFGFTGILLCACIANIAITGIPSIKLTFRNIRIGTLLSTPHLIGMSLIAASLILSTQVISQTRSSHSPWLLLLGSGMAFCLIILPIIWAFIIPRSFKTEIAAQIFRRS